MNHDLRRQYLAALGIPLWVPRYPLALQPAFSPLPVGEGSGVRAEDGAQNPFTDDSTRPMNDAPPPRTENAAADGSPVILAPNHRAVMIAGMDWEPLAVAVQECTACGLCTSRTQTVFGVGNHQADWLIIGEAPGADEDRLGEPFVGRAGKLLNPMLLAVGLNREQVFIANVLKCRPPDNRDPAPEEATQCRPFLNRQIALIRPRIILAVGRIAAQNLLATDTPIGKLRGQVHRFGPTRIPLVVTYHPAYLLRSPREKRRAWDDLRLARRVLTLESPPP
ncbi:MAG: uracil-DNA glycosylase [Candidatus Competibacteraceae bacterium]|uniref:Type-4 uracil-DNA glycosylase n=1 Tax=Candidatus Contendobacter odensis Run_B_J11 TaxID=1400861 RepID=A0A7U7G883_9GAMM|nr:uracil-DNA glycosylase [Candidatus Contendobacter odensis]MBK8536067.1 uracil-DNA glycosylase [Candidatus Competibacteraceae bacterium]MBK8750530.1 uracil-DNA glycosylase [Candidatus Competibacteraceae bacterium]CDH43370.1 Phage SPO1 DNA polymerase-related protein [Candidatus Contendobacter odensis Run_B_J11]